MIFPWHICCGMEWLVWKVKSYMVMDVVKRRENTITEKFLYTFVKIREIYSNFAPSKSNSDQRGT